MSKVPVAIACCVVLSLVTVACGSRDAERKRAVEEALRQANLPNVTVEVDQDGTLVYLQGTVGTMSQRSRADEVAAAAVGTSGQVLNELTVHGINSDTADDFDGQIEEAIDDVLDRDPVLKERDINLRVVNGIVTITGVVRSAAEKEQATQLVRLAPGVKDLANALEIQPEP